MWRNLIAVALVLASFPADAKKAPRFTALNCTPQHASAFILYNGTWGKGEPALFDQTHFSPFVIDAISKGAGTAILRGTPDLALTISNASGRLVFSSPSESERTITVFTGDGPLPYIEHLPAAPLGNGPSMFEVRAGQCLPIYDDTAAQPAPSATSIPTEPPDACLNLKRDQALPDELKQAILKDLRNRGLCPTN
jgi:hypothetical protein